MVLRSETAQVLRKGDGKPFNKRRKMAPKNVRKDQEVYFQFDADTLWDILFRLPIEALLRCCCVCKTWYNAIKNPAFISMHMNISSKQPPRFICQFTPLMGHTPLREDSPFNENHLLLWDTEDGKTRKMPLDEKLNKVKGIIFSHNGLLCIVTSSCLRRDSLFICNPITKERIELPPITKKGVNIYGLGFCFVPERQKHIVVQALYSSSRDHDQPLKFYILTSGQRSWRLLTSPPSINRRTYLLVGETVYWNNAFHWRATKSVGGPDYVCILSFDTIRETFQIIPFPKAREWFLELLVLNGRLSVIYKHGVKMEVWEVTGDKVGEFSLVCRETYDIGTNDFSLVFRLPKNKNLLVRYCPPVLPSGFVVASNDMKQYEDLKIDGLPSNFNVSSYSPSLVSVHSMGFS